MKKQHMMSYICLLNHFQKKRYCEGFGKIGRLEDWYVNETSKTGNLPRCQGGANQEKISHFEDMQAWVI